MKVYNINVDDVPEYESNVRGSHMIWKLVLFIAYLFMHFTFRDIFPIAYWIFYFILFLELLEIHSDMYEKYGYEKARNCIFKNLSLHDRVNDPKCRHGVSFSDYEQSFDKYNMNCDQCKANLRKNRSYHRCKSKTPSVEILTTNTGKEYTLLSIAELLPRDIKSKYIANVKKYAYNKNANEKISGYHIYIGTLLRSAFAWSETPEGGNFWHEKANKYERKLLIKHI